MTNNEFPSLDVVEVQIRRRIPVELGFDARILGSIRYLSLVIFHSSFTTRLTPKVAIPN